ncbi:[Pyruvate dehydrogenase (acetyl-transferring)] kinase [Forsythia ovata]|uniref:Protein-serine/threonine kinase n=1 Tax=Forsythia ovata TaxID=205694 RepID=A0ABD1WH77_9LAMI
MTAKKAWEGFSKGLIEEVQRWGSMKQIGISLRYMTEFRSVRDWYLDSFSDLRSFPDIKDKSDELEFTQMIKMIKVRHHNVVPTMALGVQQLKKDLDTKIDYNEDLDEIQQFLDRFYMSRIGIRMLIG